MMILLPFSVAISVTAQQTPTINDDQPACLKVAMFSDFGETVSQIILPQLQRMYSLAGLCMKPVYLPSKRSSRQLLAGNIDAEMIRLRAAVTRSQGQGILVPQPIFITDMALSWIEGLEFDGSLEGLAGHSVGLLRGQLSIRERIEPYADNITLLQTLDSAAELLGRGRIDIIVSDGVTLSEIRNRCEAKNFTLISKSFMHVNIFHMLHIRHADKAERLALALRTMIVNGEMASFDAKYGLFPAKVRK
jgi:polar amino acid transport system substrate-binding protein